VAYGCGMVALTPAPLYSANPQRSASYVSNSHGCRGPAGSFVIGTTSTSTDVRSLDAARNAQPDVALQSISGVLFGVRRPVLWSKLRAVWNSTRPMTAENAFVSQQLSHVCPEPVLVK